MKMECFFLFLLEPRVTGKIPFGKHRPWAIQETLFPTPLEGRRVTRLSVGPQPGGVASSLELPFSTSLGSKTSPTLAPQAGWSPFGTTELCPQPG